MLHVLHVSFQIFIRECYVLPINLLYSVYVIKKEAFSDKIAR